MNQEVEPFIQQNVAWAKLPPHVKQVFVFSITHMVIILTVLILLYLFTAAWWGIQGV